MRVRTVGLLLLLPLVSACSVAPRTADMLTYELSAGKPNDSVANNLGAVEVAAPSWLDSNAMQYRPAYGDGARRSAYSQSRWVAQPAEMLAQLARRSLLSGSGSGRCRLHLELDEFVQVFDSPSVSHVVMEVRVSLLPPQERNSLARQSFSISKPAATPDASGGMAALNGASSELLHALRVWLDGQGKLLQCYDKN